MSKKRPSRPERFQWTDEDAQYIDIQPPKKDVPDPPKPKKPEPKLPKK